MYSIEEIIADPPAEGVTVEPAALFGSPGPFELEVGCGKGGFLLSRGRANPYIRLLGVEWANQYFRYCADRMARWQLANVRVMRADARDLVMNHLPPACVSILHLYHPDPWPKRRHHKRRLVRPDFAEAVVRCLTPGACWLIQSDHEEYFNVMREVIDRRDELRPIPWDQAEGQAGPGWAGTNFEVKYSAAGRAIYRAAYVLI